MEYVKQYLKGVKLDDNFHQQFGNAVLFYKYEVFEEWVNYARLIGYIPVPQTSTKELIPIPLTGKTAHDFLVKDRMITLFAHRLVKEPVSTARMHKQTKAIKLEKGHTCADIDLNADYEKIVQSFKQWLKTKKTGPVPSWESSDAILKPSLAPKYIKLDKIRTMRKVYEAMLDGAKRADIAEAVGFITDYQYQAGVRTHVIPVKEIVDFRHEWFGNRQKLKQMTIEEQELHRIVESVYEPAMRKVSRYRQWAEQILENVKQGSFP